MFICCMDTSISTALIDFIRLECAISSSVPIEAGTEMQRDLGVYGDDAVEFLMAYSKTFQVEVIQFMAADYFDAEGFDVLFWLKPQKHRNELTVLHLQKGIAAKRLDEQAISEA